MKATITLLGILVLLLTLSKAQSSGRKVVRPQRADSGPVAPAAAATPAAPPILSPGILVGNTLYLAGQGSRDPATGRHPEGFEAQVKQSLENLGAVLRAGGMDFSNVVCSNVYLTDINNFDRMNEVYRTYFAGEPPARTTVAVPALPGGSQVEITFIASTAPKKIIRYEGYKPSPNAPYSPAMMSGDLLYLSGQGSRSLKTGVAPEGAIEDHVRQTLENVSTILKAAGMDFSQVVSSNVYLSNMDDFQKMNDVYRSFFKTDPPARTTVGVSALPRGTPVEITVIASRAQKKVIPPPEGIKPSPNFSQAVETAGRVYPAGKAGSVEDLEAQVKEVMDGLGAVLKGTGKDYGDVTEAKVYLTDIGDYARMNAVYRSYFKSDPPARTCVAVSRLVGTARVEITFVVAER
jgi:reactive intermediate/imine deaminase